MHPIYIYIGDGNWSELDDDEDVVDWVPPHKLVAGRRRAASLSLNGVVVIRTLKVQETRTRCGSRP